MFLCCSNLNYTVILGLYLVLLYVFIPVFGNNVSYHYKSIIGQNIKLSLPPTNTVNLSISFTSCALACEVTSGCEAFNFRHQGSGQEVCEIFDYKTIDVWKNSESETGSTYFEQVSYS